MFVNNEFEAKREREREPHCVVKSHANLYIVLYLWLAVHFTQATSQLSVPLSTGVIYK